ncbi:excalibur calcium-binding domain-containing protein [Microbulbifer marinus]|uniref:Excalibur calcium-binding domain-containing protein n=1 Tax=Microbulbifer marinus TaxID=658218 RepID=A0A1H4B1H5_9GAMM|nr:excalibur calcium-binding domain-containing protein [Microbulbifer marinus]SEA41949.1 Excalibur calcium-binding domain-containing protein [Microbulbifer marinus]
MKKLVIVALLGFAGWKIYAEKVKDQSQRWGNYSVQNSSSAADSMPTIKLSPAKYSCDGRRYCSQMRSREEAEFFIKNCPNTKMDGDRDGIPCENDSRF